MDDRRPSSSGLECGSKQGTAGLSCLVFWSSDSGQALEIGSQALLQAFGPSRVLGQSWFPSATLPGRPELKVSAELTDQQHCKRPAFWKLAFIFSRSYVLSARYELMSGFVLERTTVVRKPEWNTYPELAFHCLKTTASLIWTMSLKLAI